MSKNPGATEIQAAKHAGQIVSTTQPSTYVEDLPPIYDNELYRLIAPFTNQRIKYWNMTQQFINDARNGKISNFEAMSRFTRGIIMPSVMIALIESGFQAI